MASLLKPIVDYYDWTLTIADDRSKGWFLVDSPKPTFWMIVAYLTMVFFGPKIMRK
jgi:elongation of very long chain fatty acids protein 4